MQAEKGLLSIETLKKFAHQNGVNTFETTLKNQYEYNKCSEKCACEVAEKTGAVNTVENYMVFLKDQTLNYYKNISYSEAFGIEHDGIEKKVKQEIKKRLLSVKENKECNRKFYGVRFKIYKSGKKITVTEISENYFKVCDTFDEAVDFICECSI